MGILSQSQGSLNLNPISNLEIACKSSSVKSKSTTAKFWANLSGLFDLGITAIFLWVAHLNNIWADDLPCLSAIDLIISCSNKVGVSKAFLDCNSKNDWGPNYE